MLILIDGRLTVLKIPIYFQNLAERATYKLNQKETKQKFD